MLAVPALQHGQLRLPQRLAPSEAVLETRIISGHHLACHAIADRPQAHDQCFGPRQEERASQPVNAFAVLHFADARLTGGERHHLRSPEIQIGRFQSGENAIIVATVVQIGAGESEPRAKQRILDVDVCLDRSHALAPFWLLLRQFPLRPPERNRA